MGILESHGRTSAQEYDTVRVMKKIMVIEKVLFKTHFCFLYVLMYSAIRNLNWMVRDYLSDRIIIVIQSLSIGFFVWFIGVNIFLFIRQSKIKWDRSDYLSVWVLLATLAIVALLEYWSTSHLPQKYPPRDPA